MAVSGTGSVADYVRSSSSTVQVKDYNDSMDKNSFLQLLVAQLQNQDPTNPMSDTEFISQMAQFSALEQMQNMASSFQSSQVYNMIGKGIVARYTNEEGNVVEIYGIVDSAGVSSGKGFVIVGDNMIYQDSILQVFDPSILEDGSQAILDASNMVGKYVKATALDENGEKYEIAGRVDKMVIDGGTIKLQIGEETINIGQITEVSADPF